MEDLNKTQLILLTLLVTFVTAISASIITTALLAEAPVSITQTINRVVERTIEKAVPSESGSELLLTEEEKQLLSSLQNFSQNTVTVGRIGEEGETSALSLGVILSKDGLIITRKGSITATSTSSYVAVLSDDSTLPLTLVRVGEADDIAVFQIATSTPAELSD
ncbi:MAG: hypothetical protein WDZ61_00160 [Parcubacteria group bacterium]